MHFNFHLSGDESPEQSRRIANAVLALGGLLAPPKSVGEITVDLKLDTSQAVEAIRDLADRADGFTTENALAETVCHLHERAVAAGVGNVEVPFTGGTLRYSMRGSESVLTPNEVTTILRSEEDETIAPPSPLAAMAEALRQKAEDERLPPPVPTFTAESAATMREQGIVVQLPATDKHGLPWDERIHSSSRAINADGTWRYRKNVPDETKRDVEAELRSLVTDDPMETLLNAMEHDISIPIPVPPLPPTPPAPPVPIGALQRTYSDVVNLIMARKVQPDTYVAILGMSLPEFAKHVIGAPNDATLMFDALDAASRP